MNQHNPARFTASIMGNPEYLDAIKDITPAKDQRMVGLEAVNPVHKAKLEKLAERLAARNGKAK